MSNLFQTGWCCEAEEPIKPENILLETNEEETRLKLTDFGSSSRSNPTLPAEEPAAVTSTAFTTSQQQKQSSSI